MRKVLGCLRLQWSTDLDDTDHAIAKRFCIFGRDSWKAGYWFGVELFCSIMGSIHLLIENFVCPSIQQLLSLSFQTNLLKQIEQGKFCKIEPYRKN